MTKSIAFKHFPPSSIANKINCHSFINEGRGERKKARNEKFIFSHVEVLFIFMLFHVRRQARRSRGRTKINSAASWMCVMARRVSIFPLRNSKKCVLIVGLCHSSVNRTFHLKTLDLNKYELIFHFLRYLLRCLLYRFTSPSLSLCPDSFVCLTSLCTRLAC